MRLVFIILLIIIYSQIFSQAPPILGENNQLIRADDDCIYQVTVPSTPGSWYLYDTGPSGIAQFRILGTGTWGQTVFAQEGDVVQARYPSGVSGIDTYGINSNTGAGSKTSIADANTSCCNVNDPSVTCIDNTLPVTWLKKTTARISNNKCQITWSVASQINNENFIIEHSSGGKFFRDIGEISGDGNYSGLKEYEFVHNTPSKGSNNYRVKQVDYDGRYEYSNVASVNFQMSGISIYPNLVNDYIYVSTSQESTLYFFDQFGTLNKTVELRSGENQVDMTDLTIGIYYLKTESGQVKRIVKQ